jgi:AcrR family transcriptional regulator
MDDSVKASPRYRSTLRAEQARLTRSRILEAAARLFLARGFAGTTVVAVAEAAGVAPETVYASLGGKRGLLEGVIDNAGTPGGASHDEAAERCAALPSPQARLRAYVAFCCAVLARTSPFHHLTRGAADGEAFAVELRARLLAQRLANQTRHLQMLVGDALRPELTLAQAAERFCALSSPEHYHLLTSELGWTRDAHEAWLAELAEVALLGLAERRAND